MGKKFTCKLFFIASSYRFKLLMMLERSIVNCPSSRVAYDRKLWRPTTYFKKASPSTSNLSREQREEHFSVVSACST